MEQNKYLTLHSFLRYGAALIALVVFVSMFFAKQIVHADDAFKDTFFTWNETFFGDGDFKPAFLGFIGYIFVIVGGLAGLAFVFIDEMIGRDLTKKLAFVAGGLVVLGGIFILFNGVVFRAINNGPSARDFRLAAGPIVFGILSIVAGCMDVAAPILDDKGL